jgi:hypothetical protein
MTGCAALSHTSFLSMTTTTTGEASTPSHRGDAFGTKLARDRRFDSSGLNLAFEGLLLGASLRLCARATSSNPR